MKMLHWTNVVASLILLTDRPPALLAQNGPAQAPPPSASSPKELQIETPEQTALSSSTTSAPPTLRVGMEEITITATKSERSTFGAPAAVSVIDREEIEALQPQAITDLLRYQAGVESGNGSLRITERPFIRGLGGNRLLLTVDGARLNFDTAHDGNLNFIDVESLERLEIVRGPASALYGSSALGGVISLRTKDPRDMLTPGQRMGARLQSSFNSANQHLTEKDTIGLNVRLFRDSSDFHFLWLLRKEG